MEVFTVTTKVAASGFPCAMLSELFTYSWVLEFTVKAFYSMFTGPFFEKTTDDGKLGGRKVTGLSTRYFWYMRIRGVVSNVVVFRWICLLCMGRSFWRWNCKFSLSHWPRIWQIRMDL